jgi:DNA-directed RNA polymerase specialized sigma24 family protein
MPCLVPVTKQKYADSYRRGFEATVRLLRSRGVPPDAADEAAQAAWATGWERLSQLRNESMLRTWVNTIALNGFRRTLRKESRLAPLEFDPVVSETSTDAFDVKRVLSLCNSQDRQLLEKTLQGCSMNDLARECGVSEGAIRLRLMRARRAARSSAEDFAHRARTLNRLRGTIQDWVPNHSTNAGQAA